MSALVAFDGERSACYLETCERALSATVFSSEQPRIITKRVRLKNGELEKVTPGQMVNGRARVIRFKSVRDLARILPELEPNEAVCWGVPKESENIESFDVFTERNLPSNHTAEQIARTKEHMTWPTGPGVMMLDHDRGPSGAAMGKAELLEAIERTFPDLAQAVRVWFPSSGSLIYNTVTGAQLVGIKGQRVYFAVENAGDIERAGKVIHERLWLAGFGWFEVSKSGALLDRSIIDASVWRPNGLDFAAGAFTEPPLEQRRGEPQILEGECELVDSRSAFPDLSPTERDHLEALRKRERAAMRPEVETVKRAYILEAANDLCGGDETKFKHAEKVITQALENSRLMGDFVITLDDGTFLSVGDILDDRERYHGRKTRDPLEPDYNGGRNVGILYLIGQRPTLYSYAHGGRSFKLVRAPRRVQSVGGQAAELTDRVLENLRGAPDLFDFGDVLATVDNGRVLKHTANTLAYTIGHEMQLYEVRKNNSGDLYEVDINPPDKLCRTLLDMRSGRGLRPLDAVITAPTLRADGSILSRPGYDPKSRLFFEASGRKIPSIPENPTEQQLTRALAELMRPFESFPFVGTLDRSVLLAALLTAAVRSAIPTAPGFAFDAPIQGSGKTLLARCVGILAAGDEPQMWPHVSDKRGDPEPEIRKRLLGALTYGGPALVWDNVIGAFDSAALGAFLTGPTFTDRILGQTEPVTVPNRVVFLMTGNNIQLAGDLPRRVLTCRIDPATDRPFLRTFKLDPAAHCRANRAEMIGAALTVIRAWITSDMRMIDGSAAPGSLASFEAWDELVRQPVAWLATQDPQSWSDPAESVTASVAQDPHAEELEQLVVALRKAFGADSFTAGDVARVAFGPAIGYSPGDEDSLSAVLTDLGGGKAPSAKSIGRMLRNRMDRRTASGYRIVQLAKRDNTAVYRVRAD